MKSRVPSFVKATSLVARALNLSAEQLCSAFRPATSSDIAVILEIRRKVLKDQLRWDDERYLRWRYEFDVRKDARCRFLVVAHDDRMFGFIGVERIRLICGSRSQDAVSLMDIMVNPEVDGSGLGIWLNMAIFEQERVAIEIGANQNSIGLITKLYNLLPTRNHYVFPVDLRRYIRARVPSSTLARIMATPANLAIMVWRKIIWRSEPVTWGFAQMRNFSESVHDLFDRRWHPDEVTFARTSAYLNWRLFENPRADYVVLGAWKHGCLMGYMAHQVSRRYDGLTELRIVDWVVDASEGALAFKLLLQRCIRFAIDAGNIDLVSLTALQQSVDLRMRRMGFFAQTNVFNTVGVRVQETVGFPELLDGSRWFLAEANSDNDSST